MCPSRRLMRFYVLAMALLLAFPSHLVLAKGSGEGEVARAERAKGTVALNLGQYEEAIDHFSQAYTLTQDPILLFNLGQAFRLAGKPDKAVASYSSFLRAAGPGTKYRAQFDRAAAEIETITPTLVCPPRDHVGTGKQPDDTNAPAPAAKSALVPPPVEPKPVEEPIEPPPVTAKASLPALAPSPPQALAPALSITTQAALPVERESQPIYKKAWFWSSVVGVLAVGGAVTWWFTRSQNQTPPSTYGSTRVLP